MKLLALWAPLADYSVASLKYLCENYDVELVLVYRSSESNAPYDDLGLNFCKQSICWKDTDSNKISEICSEFMPDVVIMSSWNYRQYMKIAKMCKERSSYVVSTFDGQWMGTLKQRFGIFISRFYLKPRIDNFFVAGDRQAAFARKLGYKNPFMGYYSANTTIESLDVYNEKRLNRFIYAGRLVKEKNIEVLLKSYMIYRNLVNDPWDLVICGKGPLSHLCVNVPGVTLMSFLQPKALKQLMLSSKCLLHLSLYEPWGLVIHEAALYGLCIISSYHTGAATIFVRDGINGFVVNPEAQLIANYMKKVSCMDDLQLESMSKVSKVLGELWTTEKWAEYVFNNICIKHF